MKRHDRNKCCYARFRRSVLQCALNGPALSASTRSGRLLTAAPLAPFPPVCCSNGGSCPDPVAGVLAVHNDKRALHLNTGLLVWNSTLAAQPAHRYGCLSAGRELAAAAQDVGRGWRPGGGWGAAVSGPSITCTLMQRSERSLFSLTWPQAWANNCSFAHSTYGENLYAESSGRSGEPCTTAPASW